MNGASLFSCFRPDAFGPRDFSFACARAYYRRVLDQQLADGILARVRNSPFVRWMGMDLSAIGDGTCELRLPVEPYHLNPGGIVHGGIIATMLDAAIGIALRTRLAADRSHVTVNLGVSFLRPLSAGTLIARGRAVHSGERIGQGEADLFDEHERLLARGTAAFLIVPASAERG